MKSISVNRDQSNAFQAQKVGVCACVREHSVALSSSAWASLFWPTISLATENEKPRQEKWYEIIKFFTSSNLQSCAGRKPSLSLTEGGLLWEEHTENRKISAPVRLQCFHISFSEAEDRLVAWGSLWFPVSSGGLRAWSTEVNKAERGRRVLKAGGFFIHRQRYLKS